MKSKPKIKESFEIINQNNKVLENDPNKKDKIKFLINCGINSMNHFNDNKKIRLWKNQEEKLMSYLNKE